MPRVLKKSAKAFTLIEVIASLFLMAIALTGIIQGQTGSIRTVVRSEKLSQAYLLAQQKMTELELDLRKTNFEALPEEQKGEFENENLKEFRWSIRLDRVDLGCFVPGDVTDSRDQTGGFFQLAQDVFEKAIRKIVVRVEWNEGGQVRAAQLAQLYVDFKNIPNF